MEREVVGASSTKCSIKDTRVWKQRERERERGTVVEEAIAVVEREPRTGEGRKGGEKERAREPRVSWMANLAVRGFSTNAIKARAIILRIINIRM